MPNANEPGLAVVPSARAERKRIRENDVSGIVIYAIALALLSSAIIAVVVLA